MGQGASREARRGIVAHGKITDIGYYPDDCQELWRDGSLGVALRASIELDDVRLQEGRITPLDMQSQACLAESQIMKQRTGTNFRLTDEQHVALTRLWQDIKPR